MRAAVYRRYGPPDVVRVEEWPDPEPGPSDLLIRVEASALSTADWRMRAAAFPGILWLPGRAMTGLLRPKHPVLGADISGEVLAAGPAVTRFAVGDRVFGTVGRGGHAELLTAPETATLLPIPEGLSAAEAAALPFGALCAVVFLRDVARLGPGQSALIVGGSGNVGCYAIQVARHLGAHVTAMASAASADLMRSLGADAVLDYRTDDPAETEAPYDLVFDTVGATDWARMRGALRRDGLFLPLNFGGRTLWHMVRAKMSGGPRLKLHVNADRTEDLQWVVDRIAEGAIRPVIDRRFALDDIAAAHAHVETRHRQGAVVIDVAG